MTLRQTFDIRQGQTWTYVFTHTASGSPVDLTGYSARMAIRYGFELSNEAYLSSGSDANGGTITLGGANGTVTLAMTAAQTAALAGDLTTILFTEPRKKAEQYVDFLYDLEIEAPDGTVTRLLEGNIRVQREVTTG